MKLYKISLLKIIILIILMFGFSIISWEIPIIQNLGFSIFGIFSLDIIPILNFILILITIFSLMFFKSIAYDIKSKKILNIILNYFMFLVYCFIFFIVWFYIFSSLVNLSLWTRIN